MLPSKKIYLKPIAFLANDEGRILEKDSCALKLAGGNLYFTHVSLMQRDKKVEKKIISVKKLLSESIFKENLEIQSWLFELTKKRNLFDKKQFKRKKSYIFGILNITPDSFSDGGQFLNENVAYKAALKMDEVGADYIDIGGESTRPGAKKVSSDKEILRVLPILQKLNHKNLNISIDTRNSSTMKFCIMTGASIVNDVSALKNDSDSLEIIKKNDCFLILMHMPGDPSTMMKNNNYKDVVLDVYDFLEERIQFCLNNGIKKNKIIIDPGIGFGKNSDQNLKILKNIALFHGLGCPIMLGVSRKRFISAFSSSESEPKKRFPGSISAALHGINNGVQIIRVHDVKETKQALDIWNTIN